MAQKSGFKRWTMMMGIFIVPIALILSQCISNTPAEKTDPRGNVYAGAASCMQCHKSIYSNYLHTAHYQTSRKASAGDVHGSFTEGANALQLSDSIKVVMQQQGNSLYQVKFVHNKPIEKHPFDIVFGGVKAETYLYWKNKQVLQLPVSYYNAIHAWGNSPGYEAGYADFSRVIGTRCFECHSSYAKELPQVTQSLARTVELDRKAMILSIDCERCHGPAVNHVNYHTEYPGQKMGKYIARYNTLTRAQKVDMCGVCHSGNSGTMLKSTFAFKPGDTLANFKEAEFYHADTNPDKLDVHGNQVQLLQSSACFIKSKMDCATCHNTHNNERGLAALFTQRCTNCHSEAKHNFCKMANRLDKATLTAQCINCHMPQKPSSVITVHNNSKSTLVPYDVRTHRIAVYPQETQKIISWLKTNQSASL